MKKVLALVSILVFSNVYAATTTLTHRDSQITVPANTQEHDIDFDSVLDGIRGTALVVMKTGDAQFSSDGTTIDSNSITLSSSGNNTRAIFTIRRGVKMKYKGTAGSETFNITIISN